MSSFTVSSRLWNQWFLRKETPNGGGYAWGNPPSGRSFREDHGGPRGYVNLWIYVSGDGTQERVS